MKNNRCRKEMLSAARGDIPCDVVIKDVKIVDVFGCRIVEGSIGIFNGYIVGIGDYRGREEIVLRGKYVCPAFIEGHIHIESTMLNPVEFARVVGRRGTQAVVADPHEIANVYGREGIEWLIACSRHLPVEIFFMAPSCVPATDMETAGGRITQEDIRFLYEHYPSRVLGLGEVMNFPAVIEGSEDIWRKLEISRGKIIDGHSPTLGGKGLNAYLMGGCKSDHECISTEEAEEKLSKGMHIFARNGSTERNLPALVPAISPYNSENFSLVTDDRHPLELMTSGHMDYNIKEAISLGVPSLVAIKMATINPARYFGLQDMGAIAPGFKASFVVLSELSSSFEIEQVYLKGRPFEDWDFTPSISQPLLPPISRISLTPSSLVLKRKQDSDRVHVIGLVPGSIVTKKIIMPIEEACHIEEDILYPRVEKDISKVVVAERHRGTGNISIGLVRGFGIKNGALASSVAHDSHNFIAVGSSDEDILLALEELNQSGGGLVVIKEKKTMAHLPLSIGGLMSVKGAEEVAEEERNILKAASLVGDIISHPFMYLSFLALPVIPELKITDRGLVDVQSFSFVDLCI